jgi:hypothetical protein
MDFIIFTRGFSGLNQKKKGENTLKRTKKVAENYLSEPVIIFFAKI